MGLTIKRRISYKDIAGITMSKLGHEFVVHVPSEYDYRFESPDKREEIISITIRQYQVEKRGQLAFWFVDDLSLAKYQTTKMDKKNGISKIPTMQPSVKKFIDFSFQHSNFLSIFSRIKTSQRTRPWIVMTKMFCPKCASTKPENAPAPYSPGRRTKR